MPWAGGRDQDTPEARIGEDRAAVGLAQADEGVVAGQDQPVGIEGHRKFLKWGRPEPTGHSSPEAIGLAVPDSGRLCSGRLYSGRPYSGRPWRRSTGTNPPEYFPQPELSLEPLQRC